MGKPGLVGGWLTAFVKNVAASEGKIKINKKRPRERVKPSTVNFIALLIYVQRSKAIGLVGHGSFCQRVGRKASLKDRSMGRQANG